jgi:hypothetical protein
VVIITSRKETVFIVRSSECNAFLRLRLPYMIGE